MHRAARRLVLVCSLLLALPSGWCCLFAGWAPAAACGCTKGSCPCCRHGAAPRPEPADKPPTPRKSTCHCYERHTTLPSLPSVEQAAISFPVLPPPLDCTAGPVAASERAASVLFGPPPPLHVCKCLWLC